MNSESRPLRLFVAIELPREQKQAVAALQDSLRAAVARRSGDFARVRWSSPDGMHLTLKFLGATPPERLASVLDALASAVPTAPAFSLSLANVRSFPDRRPPQVIVAGVSGQTQPLYQLAERIETALAAAGWPNEKRAFNPHVTLGRLPQDSPNQSRRALAEITSAVKLPPGPAWTVDHISLMQSHLGREGAHYERVARFPS